MKKLNNESLSVRKQLTMHNVPLLKKLMCHFNEVEVIDKNIRYV